MSTPAVAIVIFPAPEQASDEEMRRLLQETGEKYTNIPGLRRKYFLAGDDSAGGIYEWDSKERAKAFYDAGWRRRMQAIYGVQPSVQIFESPAIANGVTHHLKLYI